MTGRRTKSLAWCAALLLLAELALRAMAAARATLPPLDVHVPLALALGTSRTMRAIDPDYVEKQLHAEGVTEVFAANISLKAVTHVGLLRHWMEQVAPRLPADARGVVAIEVRCEAFNDTYLLDDERAWLESDALDATAGGPLLVAPRADRLSADALSHAVVSQLLLFAPADIVSAWWDRLDGGEAADWASTRPGSRRGFRPFENEVRLKDLNRAYWEEHYRTRLLKDFAWGGLQTEAVVRLVAEVRRAGLVPMLYLMPISDVHREFFAPGAYASVLAHIHALAERLDTPFLDIDAAQEWPPRSFQDTNHMVAEASHPVSRLLARQGLAPLLAPR